MTERDDMTEDRGFAAGEAGFDDDRLLGFVLGLDDDPQLQAAAESDPALRAHLEAVRADVTAVGAGLDRAVPAPPEDYTDLNDPRWRRLRELVAASPTAAPRRRPLWVRLLAPAVAIGLVLLVGIVGVQYFGQSGGTAELSRSAGDEKAAQGVGEENGAVQSGATGDGGEGAEGAVVLGLPPGAPDASAYATVLVARARTPADDRQRFDVVRVLRGHAQEYAEGAIVTLDVVDGVVPAKRLVVLYLTPLPTPAPTAPAIGAATPTPGERPPGRAVVAYGYRGGEALVLQLPADADPEAPALP